jgi:carbonic anhydrase
MDHLFEANRQWAARIKAEDPDFFDRLKHVQSPKYLWIGCSDSRVPANQILGLDPGEVFVHRNVANLVIHTDFNCLSVLQYAVDVLRVEHIIVCGHYGCGGVRAALHRQQFGLIDNWLRHIVDIHQRQHERFAALRTDEDRENLLCELNVIDQAAHIAETTIFQNAVARGQLLQIHAWIYRLADGLLNDLGFRSP